MKILIIKIAAIGDVVMALPMIDAIREKDSNARISWLCGETVLPLLKALGTIDEIIAIDEKKLLTGSLLERLSSLTSVWKQLSGHSFDLIVTGHSDPRYRLLSLTATAKERRSFVRGNKRSWPVPGRQHADEYIRLVTNIDGPEAGHGRLPKLSAPLPDNLKAAVNNGGHPVVALSPGGAKNVLRDDAVRRWPLENYVALASILRKEGIKVIITGASSDQWILSSFSRIDVIDLVGRTSIADMVALFGACDLVISNDSSPLHLAALAGTHVLALFGPTNPHEKVPSDNRVKTLWGGENLACRPCYDGKTYATCANNICMQEISVDEVYKVVGEILHGEVLKP